jgi:N-acetylglucosamine malate deacetylase 2
MPASLVVFATDGAAPGHGSERNYGSLKAFSELRFQEARRALAYTPNALFQRLARPNGSYFVDQHLFEELPEAAVCLRGIARSFSPDVVISHAYEGGHIDHDACAFLAMHAAADLGLQRYEFPLYWMDAQGKSVVQQFRDIHNRGVASGLQGSRADVVDWKLSEEVTERKTKMLETYQTQAGLALAFPPSVEQFRLAPNDESSFTVARCSYYSYRNRRRRLRDYFPRTQRRRIHANALLKKFAEFEAWQRRGGATTKNDGTVP